MAENNLHLRMMGTLDGFDEAFSEWDENAPTLQIAQGSRPHASEAAAEREPVTTRRFAKASQQIAVPRRIPQTLEEALLALAEEHSPPTRR